MHRILIALAFFIGFGSGVVVAHYEIPYCPTPPIDLNSVAYNAGMQHDLEDAMHEYFLAKPAGKVVLKTLILRKYSTYPEEKMTVKERNFYNMLLAFPN